MASGHSPAFSIASWIPLFSLHELGTQAVGKDLSLAQESGLLAVLAQPQHYNTPLVFSVPHRVSLPQMPSWCCGCCCYYCNLLPGEQPHVSPGQLVVILLPIWPACLVHLHIKIFAKSLRRMETEFWFSELFWDTYKNCELNKTEAKEVKWLGESPSDWPNQDKNQGHLTSFLDFPKLLPKWIGARRLSCVRYSACRVSWSLKSRISSGSVYHNQITEGRVSSLQDSVTINLPLGQWSNLIF